MLVQLVRVVNVGDELPAANLAPLRTNCADVGEVFARFARANGKNRGKELLARVLLWGPLPFGL